MNQNHNDRKDRKDSAAGPTDQDRVRNNDLDKKPDRTEEEQEQVDRSNDSPGASVN